jgi:integrase/recombinase XerD
MLSIARRHTRSCIHGRPAHDREWRKCSCIISVRGTVGGKTIQESLHTRNWADASRIVMEAESRGTWGTTGKSSKTVLEAYASFLLDAASEKGRALRSATLSSYQTLGRKLEHFLANRGLKKLADLTPEEIRHFRDSLNTGPRATGNYLVKLGCFLRFCLQNEWIDRNPAAAVKPPKAGKGTDYKKHPFTADEMKAILEKAAGDRELETFILLLRHSGLRISDATFLRRQDVSEDGITLVTIKTRSGVTIPLPADVLGRLNEVVARREGEYLFLDGPSMRLGTATDRWRRRIHAILRALDIKKKTAHCFRHTFATELLASGVPIELVSRLLTHSSVTITERFYASWIRRSQDRLQTILEEAWKKSDVS